VKYWTLFADAGTGTGRHDSDMQSACVLHVEFAGSFVGGGVGTDVGVIDGASVGARVGVLVGARVGPGVGVLVGEGVTRAQTWGTLVLSHPETQ
jgi:hypothetical protein